MIIFVLYNFQHPSLLTCLTDVLSLDVTVIITASPVDTVSEWEELLKNVTFFKVMHKMMLSCLDFSLISTNMEVFDSVIV